MQNITTRKNSGQNYQTREAMNFLNEFSQEDIYVGRNGEITPIPTGNALVYSGGKARPNSL